MTVDLNQDEEPSDDDITQDARGSGIHATMIGSLMYVAECTQILHMQQIDLHNL